MIPVVAPDRYDRAKEDAWRGQVTDAVTKLERLPQQDFISADRGDASITLNAGTDVPIQRFATALTQNRTVTLGTGANGAWFTIVRSGLGAFTLDVGPGLKTLPIGTATWCDVGHTGAGWILLRDGTL